MHLFNIGIKQAFFTQSQVAGTKPSTHVSVVGKANAAKLERKQRRDSCFLFVYNQSRSKLFRANKLAFLAIRNVPAPLTTCRRMEWRVQPFYMNATYNLNGWCACQFESTSRLKSFFLLQIWVVINIFFKIFVLVNFRN